MSTVPPQGTASQTRPGSASSLMSNKTSVSSMNRSSSKNLADDNRIKSSSRDSLKPRASSISSETTKQNEELLNTFRSEFDNLRNLITCKICCRLLYEPFTISCGHTYCYSCLSQWFVSNKAKKTCPDCRSTVTQVPAPAYLIREMTHSFIKRSELLPSGETIQEHAKWQEEEAKIVLQDRNNEHPRTGGLFKGCFHTIRRPFRDEEDGVERCTLCGWELEDGACMHCGLQYDDDGTLTWGNSFGGFSDMDEASEHDMTDELDEEMMDDTEYDEWGDSMHRWIHGMPRYRGPYPFAAMPPRHRAAHSAAGSLRYSASLAEDASMGTLEEEDEDELEDEDSSMNDFIDDEEHVGVDNISTSTAGTPSVGSQAPPSNQRIQRNRRVIPSETSSDASHAVEDEDEEDEDNDEEDEAEVDEDDEDDDEDEDDDDDEDEEGPIPNGRRRPQLQPQGLRRANGTTLGVRPPASTTSTETSVDTELDHEEDRQRLLSAQGWAPLGQDITEDDMEEDEEYESDGGRTEVGWEPTANPNFRSRIGGSLTPTADRTSALIRPPSRIGITQSTESPHTLRRRNSAVRMTASTYGDSEADDDDSDMGRDGDAHLQRNTLRPRNSRLRLRDIGVNRSNRNARQPDIASAEEDDSDSVRPPPGRQEVYSPRISRLFAQHQAELDQYAGADAFFDQLDQLRAITPVQRPRTANRNRALEALEARTQSPFQTNSIFASLGFPHSPARLRTPGFGNTTNNALFQARRNRTEGANISNELALTMSDDTRAAETANTVISSTQQNGTAVAGTTRPATHVRTVSQNSSNGSASMSSGTSFGEVIERPMSRISARPPSAQGRRSSANFVPGYQTQSSPLGVGLNYATRAVLQASPTNPWRNHGLNMLRSRQSAVRLRERDSTQTLRPSSSRQTLRAQPSSTNVRDTPAQPQSIRPQASRNTLRPRVSHQRLQQITLGLPPARPSGNPGQRLSEEERARRGQELLANRARSLGINPFAARGAGRPQIANNQGIGVDSQQQSRQFSGNNMDTGLSRADAPIAGPQVSPTGVSPIPTGGRLNRRRSRQNVGVPGVSHPQSPSVPAPNGHANGFPRARSGQIPGSPRLEMHMSVGTTLV